MLMTLSWNYLKAMIQKLQNFPVDRNNVSIARIFLNNPPIIILDEATSALDLESESIIQDALNILSENRTTLIVAHRLSTITHADKIVVIENGEIVETGTHEALLAKKGAYEHLIVYKICKIVRSC